MTTLTYVSGNAYKVDFLKKWLGHDFEHVDLDIEELQELDPQKVVEHKARAAYAILKRPILTEDTSVTFNALGRLPGTQIKWFLEELGVEGCCRILDGFKDRTATARAFYVLYDGKEMRHFDAVIEGTIVKTPRGSNGFGWNPIFEVKELGKTYAEMTEEEWSIYGARAIAIGKIKSYLDRLEA